VRLVEDELPEETQRAIVKLPHGAPTEIATAPARPSPIADKGTIRSQFRDCGNGFVGQVIDTRGVTCADVCRTYGYSRCRGRADQNNFETCRAKRDVIGSCSEPWRTGWTSQCDCTNTPLSQR
jgi:hypothetical protein